MTFTPTVGVPVKVWTIDRARSLAEFGAKRMAVATTRGRFSWVEGTLGWDEAAPASSWWSVTIDVPRARTSRAPAAEDSPFDGLAQGCHTIAFRSTRVERLGAFRWQVVGDMTLGEVTREVTLAALAMDRTRDGCGRERVVLIAEAALNGLGPDGDGRADSGGSGVPIHMVLQLSLVPNENR